MTKCGKRGPRDDLAERSSADPRARRRTSQRSPDEARGPLCQVWRGPCIPQSKRPSQGLGLGFLERDDWPGPRGLTLTNPAGPWQEQPPGNVGTAPSA
ncbi:hypothetical protein P7K49_004365 [Saguinus oedipus]|uniref:Uncharacterized protein n=1 Tax=Saguinus oedipus TaxID=9490 RepID=A0ABQ9W7A3_SAGOE|nr:hypothetical protein P7K49_004365 [Saguinus oedipus]